MHIAISYVINAGSRRSMQSDAWQKGFRESSRWDTEALINPLVQMFFAWRISD